MKKYLVRNFLKRVKFDYFFRFINLSFISKIFFKRFVRGKFGNIGQLNNLCLLSRKRYLNTRFLFIFFRNNFFIHNFNFHFNRERFNDTLLISGVFSKNCSQLNKSGGDYCFFFNSLSLSSKIFDTLSNLSFENFLCEGLNSKIYKLKDYKFMILSFRFFNKILSVNWLPNLNVSYTLFTSHYFYLNGHYFSLIFFFIYYYVFFIIFNLNIICLLMLNVLEIVSTLKNLK